MGVDVWGKECQGGLCREVGLSPTLRGNEDLQGQWKLHGETGLPVPASSNVAPHFNRDVTGFSEASQNFHFNTLVIRSPPTWLVDRSIRSSNETLSSLSARQGAVET